MSNQTTNYKLTKPDFSNSGDIEVLNTNFDTIDAEIKKVNDKVGDMVKTDSTLQTGLNAEMVGGKRATDFASATNVFNQDTTDLNTYNPNKTWTARVGNNNPNRPTVISDYSTVLNVGSDNNSNFQIVGSYDNSNKLGYRCRHDTDGTYGDWKRILTQDDYNNLFQSVSNGKSAIANAITDSYGVANSGMTFSQLANAVPKIFVGNFVIYNGNTATVSLPFTPKLVITYGQTTNCATTYIGGHSSNEPYSGYVLTIVANGFTQSSAFTKSQTWNYVAIG